MNACLPRTPSQTFERRATYPPDLEFAVVAFNIIPIIPIKLARGLPPSFRTAIEPEEAEGCRLRLAQLKSVRELEVYMKRPVPVIRAAVALNLMGKSKPKPRRASSKRVN